MGVGIKNQQNRLYIRLPQRIEEESQIKDLHRDIIIVHLPRQKSRRWCIVEFKNKEKLQEALPELRKVVIEGKFITIKKFKVPKKAN